MKRSAKIIYGIAVFLVGSILLLVIIDEILSMYEGYNTKIISFISFLFLALLLLYVIMITIFSKYQSKIIKEQEKKPVEEKIQFWKSLLDPKNKLFLINQDWNVYLNLALIYLKEGKNEEAISYLNSSSRIKKNSNAYYPFYLVSLYQNKIEEASCYYAKLLKSKDKRLEEQKRMAIKINEMVLKESYDDEISFATNYPMVKELCERYH